MKYKIYTVVLISLLVVNNTFSQTSSLTEMFEEVVPSVVKILVKSEVSKGVGDPYEKEVSGGLGAGVLMSKDGEIFTAAHVVDSASEIEIVYRNGETSSASIVNVSGMGDVALLKADYVPKGIAVAKFGDSDKVKIGDDVFIVGFPMGLDYSLSKGIISGRHDQELKLGEGMKMEFFQTDASINTGNSGGPMFNYKGEVIGIVSSILSRSGGFEGIGFASTSNLTKKLLYKDGRFWFGIDGTYLNGPIAKILNIPQEGGLLVTSVTPNSPAYFLGIRGGYLKAIIAERPILVGGDIILSIDGITLDSVESVSKVWAELSSKKQFDTVKFKVLRSGEIKKYKWKVM